MLSAIPGVHSHAAEPPMPGQAGGLTFAEQALLSALRMGAAGEAHAVDLFMRRLQQQTKTGAHEARAVSDAFREHLATLVLHHGSAVGHRGGPIVDTFEHGK